MIQSHPEPANLAKKLALQQAAFTERSQQLVCIPGQRRPVIELPDVRSHRFVPEIASYNKMIIVYHGILLAAIYFVELHNI
jgi:hypothetical protein